MGGGPDGVFTGLDEASTLLLQKQYESFFSPIFSGNNLQIFLSLDGPSAREALDLATILRPS
jgi:hypothetical protein